MKRIAIVGAGPIGLEAAAYARRLGHEATVYEKGRVCENVGRWGHVVMFSPWRMNISALAAGELEAYGWTAPDPEACPSGREYRERYLLPLAAILGDAVQTGVEVAGIAREGLLKGEGIGGDRRAARPFRLLLRKRGGEELWATADVVIDASGVYGNGNSLGPGGLPARGERELGNEIERGIPDLQRKNLHDYIHGQILLVGGGHSAATSLLALSRVQADGYPVHVAWAWRSGRAEPFHEVSDDPLAARAALAKEGNRLARDPPPWLQTFPGFTVDAFEKRKGQLWADLRAPDGSSGGCRCDSIISNVGYRPDLSLERELQGHFCYASEGSMRLAAKLLGAGTDCLRMPSVGPDAYRHPEPGFFVLGQKSFGRSPAFLLANGREGIRDVFRLVERSADLDLYARAS